MPIGILAVVLAAALLHVSWNSLVKTAPDGFLAAVLIAAGGAVVSVLALPFLPPIAPGAWCNVAGSVIAQSIYYPLVAATYRAGDMSHTYPVMRGTAPMLVALVSVLVLGEPLTAGEWVGVGLICAGIWAIGSVGLFGRSAARSGRATGLALLTAVVIAGYTLIDGAGVRRSGSPAAYTGWIFLFTAVPLVTFAVWRRRSDLTAEFRHRWWVGLAGGAASVGAYGLVLWAMTKAPVAVVAALRETSIVFATLFAVVVLKEATGRARVLGTLLIAAGAVAIRLA